MARWEITVPLVLLIIVLAALIIALAATFLSAEPPTVTVLWTAPGDDGNVGIATEYDLRYHPDSAVVAAWHSAFQVTDEPVPDTAGSTQTYTFHGLPSDSTFFCALKTRDENYNWSELSNILRFSVPDTQGPAAIVDLRE